MLNMTQMSLAELPTDSESEAADSGQEEENAQLEGQ